MIFARGEGRGGGGGGEGNERCKIREGAREELGLGTADKVSSACGGALTAAQGCSINKDIS